MDGLAYTVDAKHPSSGWSRLAGLFGCQEFAHQHEHALPGGPVSMSFSLSGIQPVPLGMLVCGRLGGVPVWSGDVRSVEPDHAAGVTRVSCRGHAVIAREDYSYDKKYLISDMSRWFPVHDIAGQDMASWPVFGAILDVASKGNRLRMGIANGVVVPSASCGWILDAGPNTTIKETYIDWISTANDATATINVYNDATGVGSRDENQSVSALNVASGTYDKVFTTARRYGGICYTRSPGATYSADFHMIINRALVASADAYISSGASALTGDLIIQDLLSNSALPLVSTSTRLISAGVTALGQFETEGYEDVYSIIERANAVDGYQWFLSGDPVPALTYRAIPTAPVYRIHPSYYTVEGNEGVSITDVYNRVRVFWTADTGAQNVTTCTPTTDTTLLVRVGRTRTYNIKVNRPCTSAEATAIGAAFLELNKRAVIRTGIRVHGSVETTSGNRIPVGRLHVGDVIQIDGMRDPATGAPGRRGIIYGVQYDHATNSAVLSIDGDRTAFDRQMAYFEGLVAS